MTKKEKVLSKILSGTSDSNIDFNALRNLLKSLNFEERISGSHHIFYKDGIEEIINLQPLPNGKAKNYQVQGVE